MTTSTLRSTAGANPLEIQGSDRSRRSAMSRKCPSCTSCYRSSRSHGSTIPSSMETNPETCVNPTAQVQSLASKLQKTPFSNRFFFVFGGVGPTKKFSPAQFFQFSFFFGGGGSLYFCLYPCFPGFSVFFLFGPLFLQKRPGRKNNSFRKESVFCFFSVWGPVSAETAGEKKTQKIFSDHFFCFFCQGAFGLGQFSPAHLLFSGGLVFCFLF